MRELDELDDNERKYIQALENKYIGNILSDDWADRNNTKRFPGWIDHLKKIYGDKYSEEYVTSISSMRNIVTIKKNHVPYRIGNSKYVNYRDGHRVVEYQPVGYNRKVVLLGRSPIIGGRLEDADTIPSRLQKALNGAGKGVLVDEFSYGGARTPDLIHALRDEVCPVRRGDVVLVFGKDEPMIPQYFRLRGGYRSLKKELFDYRKKWQNGNELYFDGAHYSLYVSDIIAKWCYKLLEDNELIKCSEMRKRKDIYERKIDDNLKREIKRLSSLRPRQAKGRIGCIVMNCNPFTKGHEYLIESALKQVDYLYIFIVEEDRSYFTFEERIQVVKKHFSGRDNIIITGSGRYMISKDTFPEYFDKEMLQKQEINPTLDLEMFSRYIAPILNISVRFVGTEPFDTVTNQYNQTMHYVLGKYGIDVVEIERIGDEGGKTISASMVRRLLKKEDFESISEIVPKETIEMLKNHKKEKGTVD